MLPADARNATERGWASTWAKKNNVDGTNVCDGSCAIEFGAGRSEDVTRQIGARAVRSSGCDHGTR